MIETFAGFDWDEGNRAKCTKHGVSLEEAEALFTGTPRVATDLKHCQAEDRFMAVGRNQEDRLPFLAYTFRTIGGTRLIRPVTARTMHKRESERYDEEGSQAPKR